MPKEAKPPRYWLAHPGPLSYISTRTGKRRQATAREIIDDLPAQSVINGKSGPNWTITEGVVVPYSGALPTGHKLPLADVPSELLAQVDPVITVTEIAPGVSVIVTGPPLPATEETP
jgi:hypothetical protein